MVNRKPKQILYRRKREQKTRYPKRLALLLSGKPRLVVRFTNQRIIAQLIAFAPAGDTVLVGLDSSALRKQGWTYSLKNHAAAYLTGLLFGSLARKKGQKEAVLDTGLRSPPPRSRLYSFLKGALDGGLLVPHGENVFPGEDFLQGKHIASYAAALQKDKPAYERQFAQYLKNKNQPEELPALFTKIKQKLLN